MLIRKHAGAAWAPGACKFDVSVPAWLVCLFSVWGKGLKTQIPRGKSRFRAARARKGPKAFANMSRERVSPNGLRKHESGTGQPPFANLAVLNMSQERFFVFSILAALQPGIRNRSFEVDKTSCSDALLPDFA